MIQNDRSRNAGYSKEANMIFPGFTTLSEYTSRKESTSRSEEQAMVWDMLPYLKLMWMRDRGPSEVGGYAITAKGDVLHVVDFFLVDQDSNAAFCKFSDDGVGDHIADCAQGFKTPSTYKKGERVLPDNSSAIWVHTHPGNSAHPSGTDHETFGSTSFSGRPWAVMFILARGGQVSCRRRYNVGPEPDKALVPVVDLDSWDPSKDFPQIAALHAAWEVEYKTLVRVGGNTRPHSRGNERGQSQSASSFRLDPSAGAYSLRGDGTTALDLKTGAYAGWDGPADLGNVLAPIGTPEENALEAELVEVDETALMAELGRSPFEPSLEDVAQEEHSQAVAVEAEARAQEPVTTE